MAGKSGKRKRLTLQEKLEAMRILHTGSLASHVMRKFFVPSRFVTILKSEGAALLEAAEKSGPLYNPSFFRAVKFPEIDGKVYQSSNSPGMPRFPFPKTSSKNVLSLLRLIFCAATTSAQSSPVVQGGNSQAKPTRATATANYRDAYEPLLSKPISGSIFGGPN